MTTLFVGRIYGLKMGMFLVFFGVIIIMVVKTLVVLTILRSRVDTKRAIANLILLEKRTTN